MKKCGRASGVLAVSVDGMDIQYVKILVIWALFSMYVTLQ